MKQTAITGKIHRIFDAQQFGSGFTKREFVVTIGADEKYPQHIKLEFVKDKCDILDKYSDGDEVEVDYNLRGNEHNGKFYVSLQAWRIARVGQERRSPNQNGAKPPQDAHNKAKADGYAPDADDESSDIPF